MVKSDDIINKENFDFYFRDCRLNKPEQGDVIAQWVGIGQLHKGRLKEDIVDLLLNKDNKALAAVQVIKKLGFATHEAAVSLCIEICKDLHVGKTQEEVADKVYCYDIEVFYYTKIEHVPKTDPCWSVINIRNLDDYLSNGLKFISRTTELEESPKIV